MSVKLSQLKAPAAAGVVKELTVRAAIAEIKNCLFDGADMIDLHLSCLENTDPESLKAIVDSTQLPILALNYNSNYYNETAGCDEEARAQSLLRAAQAGVAGIDMQGYTFDIASKTSFCGEDRFSFTKNNPREVVTDPDVIARQCELIEQVHGYGAEVLMSCHPGIVMTAEQVVELALFMENRSPDIIKIVSKAENEDDLAESIRAMLLLKKEVRTPVSYHANGKAGSLSRIINPLLGGQIAFCVDRYAANSTMEQLDLRTVRSVVDGVRKLI